MAIGSLLPSFAYQNVTVNGQSVNTSYARINSFSSVNSVFPGRPFTPINQGVFINQFNQQRVNYSAPGAYNNYSNQVINIQNRVRVRNF